VKELASRAGVHAVSAGRDSVCCIKRGSLSMRSHRPWPRHFLVLLPRKPHEKGGVLEGRVGGSFQQSDALGCTNKWAAAIFLNRDLPLTLFKKGPMQLPAVPLTELAGCREHTARVTSHPDSSQTASSCQPGLEILQYFWRLDPSKQQLSF